jgi:hypothetical protein
VDDDNNSNNNNGINGGNRQNKKNFLKNRLYALRRTHPIIPFLHCALIQKSNNHDGHIIATNTRKVWLCSQAAIHQFLANSA